MQHEYLPLSQTLSRVLGSPTPGPLVMDSAFTRAKDLLSSIPELVHPHPDAPISLALDASDTHLGAVLQQILDGSWASLVFYSKKLSDTEKKYSAFNFEILAAYSSLCHFRFMLEGRYFTIFVSSTTSPTWPNLPVQWFRCLAGRML